MELQSKLQSELQLKKNICEPPKIYLSREDGMIVTLLLRLFKL